MSAIRLSVPAIRFSLGSLLFIFSLLLIADCIFKFTEAGTNALVEKRTNLCETMIDRAIFLIKDDMDEALRKLINDTARNNTDILSLALNDRYGDFSIATTGHKDHWNDLAGDRSSMTQIQLPVFNENKRWGTLQVRLKVDGIYIALYLLQLPLVKSILFICLFGFFAYSWFIKKTFNYFNLTRFLPGNANAALPDVDNLQIISSEEIPERLATRDPLTGCLNRCAFFEKFKVEFSNAQEMNTELCCIMANIDHFKNINDTYGYDVGDLAIKSVVKIINSSLRSNDIICRYSGEKFCILLIGMDLDRAIDVAERMRRSVKFDAGSTIREPSDIKITSSFGVTSIKFGAETPEKLAHQADKALYESKKNGRNQVSHFSYENVINAN